jgi:peptidylprolyl isomerase
MAKTTERAFALTLAILFLVTTVGFSAYFIWEMTQDSKNATDTTATAEQQQDQTNQPKDYMQDFEPYGDKRIEEFSFEDKKVGTGAEAKATSTVKVQYTGALAKDGAIFDSTATRGGEPAEFSLEQVVKGFQQGITGMKVGGERRIFIPAALGYANESPSPDIPADSDLVFDVTLVEVK